MSARSKHKLLTREAFKEQVLARDKGRCLACGEPAINAHHIMDRDLFADGGYYVENGASVCSECHIKAEQTVITVKQLVQAAGLKQVMLPPQLDDDQQYEKWGNPIYPNGMRGKGELFYRTGVQKILGEGRVLDLYTNRYKYPRTSHLPFSLSVSDDDKVMTDFSRFNGKRVIASLKKDGENTTFYTDYYHARSLDGRHHPSRDWVKAYWASIAHNIPVDWRVCGENLYAKHSIAYENLKSYFYGFSVWDDRNVCLAWDETLEYFELLTIQPVEVIYDEIFDLSALEKLAKSIDPQKEEGFVVRLAEEIPYRDFGKSFCKYVREKHVTTDTHWMNSEIVPNRLIG